MTARDMPIISDEQLEHATPELIQLQIGWQISLLIDPPIMTQEKLGQAIGREQTFVSRVMHAKSSLVLTDAEKLDELFDAPEAGWSFEKLVKQREQRKREDQRSSLSSTKLFLAGAMSAPTTTYETARSNAMDLASALELYCKFEVYYAGRSIHSERQFDAADLGYQSNYDYIRTSTQFVLLWEGMPLERQDAVSSIWVEAGIALALGIPSTYFVPDLKSLPYILRQATSTVEHKSMPRITVRPVKNTGEAVDLVKRSGRRLFL